MSNLLYTHSKNDLEKIVRLVVQEVHRTDVLSVENTAPENDRLSQKEAAKLLGITVASLIQWKKKKLVPYFQIGRSIFYSKKELLQIAKKNRELLISK